MFFSDLHQNGRMSIHLVEPLRRKKGDLSRGSGDEECVNLQQERRLEEIPTV
jgi:hypothetical protein